MRRPVSLFLKKKNLESGFALPAATPRRKAETADGIPNTAHTPTRSSSSYSSSDFIYSPAQPGPAWRDSRRRKMTSSRVPNSCRTYVQVPRHSTDRPTPETSTSSSRHWPSHSLSLSLFRLHHHSKLGRTFRYRVKTIKNKETNKQTMQLHNCLIQPPTHWLDCGVVWCLVFLLLFFLTFAGLPVPLYYATTTHSRLFILMFYTRLLVIIIIIIIMHRLPPMLVSFEAVKYWSRPLAGRVCVFGDRVFFFLTSAHTGKQASGQAGRQTDRQTEQQQECRIRTRRRAASNGGQVQIGGQVLNYTRPLLLLFGLVVFLFILSFRFKHKKPVLKKRTSRAKANDERTR